jgi:hypothetical protein
MLFIWEDIYYLYTDLTTTKRSFTYRLTRTRWIAYNCSRNSRFFERPLYVNLKHLIQSHHLHLPYTTGIQNIGHCVFPRWIFPHRRWVHRRINRRTAANWNQRFVICHFACFWRSLQCCRTMTGWICLSFLKNSLPRQQEVGINQIQLPTSNR